MSNEIIRGRHRAPGRHNPLNELKLLARESAQPALKGAAVVAATGGLVASFAGSASAETVTSAGTVSANIGSPQVAAAAAPAVVGPAKAAAPAASTALDSIGFTTQPKAAAATAKAPVKPRVIEDLKVKQERRVAAITAKAAAAKAAALEAAAARKATAERRAPPPGRRAT